MKSKKEMYNYVSNNGNAMACDKSVFVFIPHDRGHISSDYVVKTISYIYISLDVMENRLMS